MTTATLAAAISSNDQHDRHEPGRNAVAFGVADQRSERQADRDSAHSTGSSSARAR